MFACLLACFLAASLPGFARAQEGDGKAGVRLPQSFDGYDDEMGPRVPSRQDEWWRVYAAKDAVPVYTDRTGSKLSSHAPLSFLEWFWVLHEDKAARMLELCRSTPEQDQWSPKLAVEEVIGWVSTNDLILSSQPYRTEHLVSRKVFVINDWREFKVANREEFEKLKVVARAAPDTAAREINKVTGLDSLFSFVYRWDRPGKEGRWALLGTRSFIPDSRPQDCIVGWVPVNRLAQWNTRIALEPDPRRTVRADIYTDKLGAEKAYEGETGKPFFLDNMVRTPAPAASWRYPLLGDVRPGDATALIGWLAGSLFKPGWVMVNDRKGGPVTRPVELVSKRDLTECRHALLRLWVPGESGRDALQVAWEESMKNVDEEVSQSPLEWFQLQYGIPFRDLSPFLSITYESIQTMPDAELAQMMVALEKAIGKLEKLAGNEEIWFDLLDEQYAWVPMAEMP